MRRLITLALLAFLVQPAFAELPARMVTLNNNRFHPKRLVITKRTTVAWTHVQTDGAVHDVDSDDETSFESEDMVQGDVFTHTFRRTGRFPYHCTFHGASGGVGMAGVIIVKPRKQ